MKVSYRRILNTAIAAGIVTSLLIADANESIAVQEQGTVIQLNGQAWTGRWIKKIEEGRVVVFLQDNWVTGALGADLLDSDRADRQKLHWFSAPTTVNVAFDQPIQHRFLDVRTLSQQWRTEIAGNILKISTPDVLVQSVRRSKQPWGDRIVIDLNQRTPWQIQQQGNTVNLVMAADLPPSLPPGINTDKGNLVKSVELQTQSKQTILSIQTTEALRPQVETLGEPARIIVDLKREYLPPSQSILWADGLRRKDQIVTLPNPAAKSDKDPKTLRFSITSLLVDLKQPGLSMRPIWSNPNGGMFGVSSLREMAEAWQAPAAINGGFFNRDRKLPVGPIKENNRWLAGPVLNRGAVAWNAKGEVFMDRLSYTEEMVVADQKPITLTNLNSGYTQKGIARYTPSWGAAYTPLTENEVIISVQGDRVVSQIKTTTVGQGQIPIPANGYVLVARQSPELAAKLTSGVQIRGRTAVKPIAFNNYPNLIGAGPLLLKNGDVVLDTNLELFRPPFDKQGASRSAIATLKEEGKVILATIQATPEGILPSLAQTAEILKKMGAVNALNLDGGGSTTLVLGGDVLNRPLGTVNSVHNGIGIFLESRSTTEPSKF